MVQKAGAVCADSKRAFLRGHALPRRLNGRLSVRAAIIAILAISLTLWAGIIKIGELILVR
jgi:hypothetical protein